MNLVRKHILYLLIGLFTIGVPQISVDAITIKSELRQGDDEVDIRINPNPAVDFFKVYGNVSFSKIQMYNIIGKEIKTFTPNLDNEYQIDGLASGIYILRFLDDKNKLIKAVKLYKR
jgi:hypothetical protein